MTRVTVTMITGMLRLPRTAKTITVTLRPPMVTMITDTPLRPMGMTTTGTQRLPRTATTITRHRSPPQSLVRLWSPHQNRRSGATPVTPRSRR